jgi:hypothetical protein
MGFYYDEQLDNTDYTIRLYTGAPTYEETEENLIAKSIFNDNFEFEIGNSWGQFEGGNFIEGLFNQLKPYAAYAGGLEKIFKGMKDKGMFSKGGFLNKIGNEIAEGNISKYLNRGLVVQGTRFVYFNGSNIEMGNLMMKFTIMHDPILGSVRDQLSKIMPYCIGKFQSAKEEATGSDDENGVTSLIGWQDPPGGFRADWKNVDQSTRGTLMLRFGNMFRIKNLVVKSCNVSMSKVRVKDESYEGSPLYADVTLTLQLGGYITRKSLSDYTGIVISDPEYK